MLINFLEGFYSSLLKIKEENCKKLIGEHQQGIMSFLGCGN